ncbi:hypothetical protein OROHE_019340 [Orobanche hederae]
MNARGRMPERLQFHYKGEVQRTFLLHTVLEEEYAVLRKIYVKMEKKGFSNTARTGILDKITKIRQSWTTSDTGPTKVYKIPYSGKKIHLQPDWMIEFGDEQGQRRFFRMVDQAPAADNDTLRFIQSKLDPEDLEEAAFIRGLQRFIDINLEREGKAIGSHKERRHNPRRGKR